MAAKLAHAMGADVTIFTTHQGEAGRGQAPRRRWRAGERQGRGRQALKGSFDFILSTIPEKHDLNPFVRAAEAQQDDRRGGRAGAAGACQQPGTWRATARGVAGSLIGSIAETQEVLDFCAEHQIGPDIQVIPIQEINHAYKEVIKGDVRFRYVIDMASLKLEEA